MFKSGKSLSVNAKTVRSNGSVLVAPKINVNSIVLTASTTIPKEVIEFFTAKGAKIEQIIEDGDKLVRLSGKFEISKAEIDAFLAKHKNLQAEGLKIQIETPLAGKKLNVKPALNLVTNEFRNSGGTLVAPTMSIAGLSLDASEDLPEEVVAFLNSKGATVEQFTSELGQRLIKLSGVFTIKREEVDQFLKQQNDLKKAAEAQDIKAEAEAEALNFQKQIRARIKALQNNCLSDVSIEYAHVIKQEVMARDDAGNLQPAVQKITVGSFCPPRIVSIEDSVQMNIGTDMSADVIQIRAKKDITLKAGQQITVDSVRHEQLKTGMLSEITAGADASFQSGKDTTIKNAVVLAAKDIIFSTPDNLNLTFEHDSAWSNPPFIPSFVFANENDDEDAADKAKAAGAKARI